MISLRSRRSLISLAFLHALLAAAIQTIPIVISQNVLNHEKQLQLSSHLAGSTDFHQTLLKRAVGAIPISSGFSDATTRQEVARRAVGSVADSAKLCGPMAPLKSTSRLRARSTPVTDSLADAISDIPGLSPVDNNAPSDEAIGLLAKRSSRMATSPSVRKNGAKMMGKSPGMGHASAPQAEYKYSRGAAW